MLFSRKRSTVASEQTQGPPRSIEQLLSQAQAFATTLAHAKQAPPSEHGWYPYHTMPSLQHLSPVLKKNFPTFQRALACGPVLDAGCADGDLAYFFASLGLDVTALDNPPTNHNWMTGVRELAKRLPFPIRIGEMDFDSQFSLEDTCYGLTFFLGTLYHLKNPFYALETLSKHARYCVLSTRIASVTPSGKFIEKEPLGYLLDEREANDDASNYWIFSPTGLLRLARRAGWRTIGSSRTASKKKPSPADPKADSRMFLFLRSQLLSSPAILRLTEGWTEVGAQQWAWTLKRFVIEVESKDATKPDAFRLEFTIPAVVASCSPVTIYCLVDGKLAGKQSYRKQGDAVFEAPLPGGIEHRKPMRFEFNVQHRFRPAPPDQRELGIIVPFRGKIQGVSEPIGFWLD